jgi:hypothetical protein
VKGKESIAKQVLQAFGEQGIIKKNGSVLVYPFSHQDIFCSWFDSFRGGKASDSKCRIMFFLPVSVP